MVNSKNEVLNDDWQLEKVWGIFRYAVPGSHYRTINYLYVHVRKLDFEWLGIDSLQFFLELLHNILFSSLLFAQRQNIYLGLKWFQ